MLTLIIGGTANGKLDFAHSLNFSDDSILYKLNDIVHELGDKDLVIDHVTSHRYKAVICDEVGCGIIPSDKSKREYRETVGRCLIELAKHADAVYRVYCGIGTRLK